MYLYLIICLNSVLVNFASRADKVWTYCICRRMVNAKRIKKYIRSIGQYTGMSNASKNVQNNAIVVARVEESLKKYL